MAIACETKENDPVIIACEAMVAAITEKTRIGHNAQSGTAR
jgi:hypothetical protein